MEFSFCALMRRLMSVTLNPSRISSSHPRSRFMTIFLSSLEPFSVGTSSSWTCFQWIGRNVSWSCQFCVQLARTPKLLFIRLEIDRETSMVFHYNKRKREKYMKLRLVGAWIMFLLKWEESEQLIMARQSNWAQYTVLCNVLDWAANSTFSRHLLP